MLKYNSLIFILVLMLVCGTLLASDNGVVKERIDINRKHPRLLLDEESEHTIISLISESPDVALVHNQIITYCDNIVKKTELSYRLNGIRLLDTSREALKRIFYLSYAYRMTNDRKYAERAIRDMKAVCEFPDWNPRHFLDVGEMALGVAIGYDWLYDVISENDREFIADAVNQRAFQPSFDKHYNRYKRYNNNWNSVCNAGIVYAAIAFHDEFPDVADAIVKDCFVTNTKFLEQYNPDGGYSEGYTYWEYGTVFQCLLFDAIENNGILGYGDINLSGFNNTGRFIQFMSAPSGKCFNFSDSPDDSTINLPLYWFAARNDDPSLLYLMQPLAENKSLNSFLKSRLLPLLPVFASRMKDMKRIKPSENFWFGKGETPVFIYRGGWDETTDAYLGVKGGSSSTSHAHMDAGAFVYEFDGVRWAADLGMPDYNFVEQKGVKLWDFSQDGQRWDIMRMRNDCHNTLTVDDSRHVVKSNAKIIATLRTDDRKGAIVDLTETLGKVKSAHREVSLDVNDWLTVKDSIDTGAKGVRLMWTMVTPAKASISDKEIILEKDEKSMSLSFDSPYPITLYIIPCAPIRDYDQPNGDYVRIGFTTDIPTGAKAVFKSFLRPLISPARCDN